MTYYENILLYNRAIYGSLIKIRQLVEKLMRGRPDEHHDYITIFPYEIREQAEI
jgi:hypothetical protein